MLEEVRYLENPRYLDAKFRTGETYRYKDVPEEEFEGLMSADSKGRYMHKHIIDHYEFERLT
jgi:KTSC domain-containing protein